MELDRNSIERRDFPAARRGYDPAEVDAHLSRIADAVQRTGSGSTAGTTAERVRAIVEAAERSAAEIEAGAREEAERSRTRARAEAAESLRRAEEAESLLAQAGAELERLRGALGTLRATLAEPVDLEPGSGAGRREAAAREEGEAATAHAEPPEADEPAEEAQETPAEAAHEAAPEQKPKRGAKPAAGGSAAKGQATGAAKGEAAAAKGQSAPAKGEVPAKGQPGAAKDAAAGDKPSAKGNGEGARVIALNMALNGTPREETKRYLEENFDLEDTKALLDDVYSG